MNTKLQNKLFEKYPEIFIQKDWTIQQSCMPWGICCGDGWYNLIDNLCYFITQHCKNNPEIIDKDLDDKLHKEWSIALKDKNQILADEIYDKIKANTEVVIPNATQVKEKFGGLCFYNNAGSEYIRGAIDLVEFMSCSVCENCGSTDNVKQTKGWIVTLCPKCMKKYNNPENHNIFKRLWYSIRFKLWVLKQKYKNAKKKKEK